MKLGVFGTVEHHTTALELVELQLALNVCSECTGSMRKDARAWNRHRFIQCGEYSPFVKRHQFPVHLVRCYSLDGLREGKYLEGANLRPSRVTASSI